MIEFLPSLSPLSEIGICPEGRGKKLKVERIAGAEVGKKEEPVLRHTGEIEIGPVDLTRHGPRV